MASTTPPSTSSRPSVSPSSPTLSDESILDTSFIYIMEDGQAKRISKHPPRISSPTTPPDSYRLSDTHRKSPSPPPPPYYPPSKPTTLSRSESASAILEGQSARSFQRTSSTPSLAARAPVSIRAQPIEDYREGAQDEKENLGGMEPVAEDIAVIPKRSSSSRGVGALSKVARPVGGLPPTQTNSSQRPLRPIAPTPTSTRGARMAKGLRYPGGMGAVAEHDGHDSPPYEPTELVDEAMYAPAPSASANARGQSRSYADVQNSPDLGSSTGSRPRRSQSFSDAVNAPPEEYAPSSRQYAPPSRPTSSMSMNTAAAPGARRVTAEERRMMEDRMRAERESADANHRRERHSGSPTALSSGAAAPHVRPSYTHQRRESDTLRSAQPSTSTTLVDRISPTARERDAARSHRRNPTAPDPPTTSGLINPPGAQGEAGQGKTWAAGDERSPTTTAGAYQHAAYGHQKQMSEQVQQVQQQRSRESHRQAPMPPPQSAPPTAPRAKPTIVVNKREYARLDLLGKGGTSKVYRVMSTSDEIFAVKRVSLDKADSETMKGYMNEIALLKRLEGNSRIIRLIDSQLKQGAGTSKGSLHLVMECGEIDFAKLLLERQGQPLNMVWIAYYWQQMLEAVHVIHEEKIVHSDLKPANFVIVKGQLKLIDFGIANAIANDTTNIQRDSQVGTVNYMSPEAIEVPEGMRRLKVGRPSDVWSLGCILYQMVYGLPPFHHLGMMHKMRAIPDPNHEIVFPEYATPIERMPGHNAPPPRALEHLARRVRRDVVMSMRACLCRNPKERVTIPDLLEAGWLGMKEPPISELIGPEEVIIDPFYMEQLLRHGIQMGANNGMQPLEDEEALRATATHLVMELKSVRGDA